MHGLIALPVTANTTNAAADAKWDGAATELVAGGSQWSCVAAFVAASLAMPVPELPAVREYREMATLPVLLLGRSPAVTGSWCCRGGAADRELDRDPDPGRRGAGHAVRVLAENPIPDDCSVGGKLRTFTQRQSSELRYATGAVQFFRQQASEKVLRHYIARSDGSWPSRPAVKQLRGNLISGPHANGAHV
jgi:hypothetical protein